MNVERAMREHVLARCSTPAEVMDYLIEKGALYHRQCRVIVLKRHYLQLVENGMPKMEAITRTAERFNVAEDTVQTAVYRFKDL